MFHEMKSNRKLFFIIVQINFSLVDIMILKLARSKQNNETSILFDTNSKISPFIFLVTTKSVPQKKKQNAYSSNSELERKKIYSVCITKMHKFSVIVFFNTRYVSQYKRYITKQDIYIHLIVQGVNIIWDTVLICMISI